MKYQAAALETIHRARSAFTSTQVYRSAMSFVNKWGTHYPSKVTYGGARYETLRYDRSTFENFTEQGIDIKLEAEGSIKKVPVGGEVQGGYKRSTSFAQTMSSQLGHIEYVGSADMDNAEPVEIELAPLSDLLEPIYFADGSSESNLRPRQETLRRMIDEHYGFDEAARLLRNLRVFELEVMYFTVSHPPAVAPEVYGTVKVKRSLDPFQGDADYSTGHAIWGRSKAAGARVVAKAGYHVAMVNPGRRVYCFVPKKAPLEDRKFSFGVYIQDYQRNEKVIAHQWHDIAMKDIARLNPVTGGTDGWQESDYPCGGAHGISMHVRYREAKLEWIPAIKRQEVESRIRNNLGT